MSIICIFTNSSFLQYVKFEYANNIKKVEKIATINNLKQNLLLYHLATNEQEPKNYNLRP